MLTGGLLLRRPMHSSVVVGKGWLVWTIAKNEDSCTQQPKIAYILLHKEDPNEGSNCSRSRDKPHIVESSLKASARS